MINLDLVRYVDTADDRTRIIFDETHSLDLKGSQADQFLGAFGRWTKISINIPTG